MNEPGGFYRKFLVFTIAIVCLLILVGGVVRSTGSGMGCPDWPKCFGNWTPPTDISQLPVGYQEVYSQKRQLKNQRLANYIEILGFDELVYTLRHDQSILIEQPFNPIKTWIEYLNRLLGVITGFLIMLNVAFSFKKRGKSTNFLKLSILNLILVGFQGWVGSIVVSTNLLGGLVTFHMLLALLILAVLIYNYWLTGNKVTDEGHTQNLSNLAYRLMLASLVLFTVQVVFGTQVRESIDLVASSIGESGRATWISNLGWSFYIHRSYSIVILLLHLYFCHEALKLPYRKQFKHILYALMGLLLIEILSGVIMAYFAIPPVFQPIHLLIATLIFGVDFYLLLQTKDYRSFHLNHKELNVIAE